MAQIYNQNEDYSEIVEGINFSFNKCKDLIQDLTNDKDRFAICQLKVTNLKMYCYRFGYKYGHAMICHVYMELKKYLDNKGVVIRVHDNILILVLWNFNNKMELEKFIEEFLAKFENPCDIMNHKIKIQMNIGLAIYPQNGEEIEMLLRYADIALDYCQKDSCKKYEFFNFDMYLKVAMKEIEEMDILNALTDKEFILYYQPQVNLYTNRIYGFEALIRWDHPLYGLLPPFLFIDKLIENGAINEVGKWIMEEACRQKKIWNQLRYKDIIVSVNVSIEQLEDENFHLLIKDLLKKFNIKASSLNIEITEHEPYKLQKSVINNLKEIKKLGARIYLDDFGTSYCYLNNLCVLPVDGIKIDKFFIDDIEKNKKKYIVTKQTIELANQLGIDVVAEGIERKEQIDYLKEIGCYKAQGYFFGKPMPFDETISILENTSFELN
ncbi:bifunctional diguanylate cyclase/phosphodiesterase [Sporanaerobacter acetigenes]|uniref:EAL domain, c-di-GMP-specific phosphodiesterase class I (Or its enzymatically inactive variant) n=1 Tax=Sporanaerobacter acetigenes DSM 13106 TaxID=1123281 RepID=A0A1M5Y3E9_9FIRM|nr:GGDEF domain-containing phosphodiesterase [Sporanaerobacter acetigenes]SHI06469.1 EAL domain, c-di-GMP-specific phosphodiesterase class I (or its enzymatically inactive variant) [Sporanaerobacter acetigenes DSM 13106]